MRTQHQPVEEGTLLWEPSEEMIRTSRMMRFINRVNLTHGLNLSTYHDLWHWSVVHPEQFWQMIWNYYEISSYSGYSSVLQKREMPGTRWFEGATLNFAEHILRMKQAESPAIIFQSEQHPYSEMSWDKLSADVGGLQSALIQAGVQKGDRVAAYMPNCPETIVAFLAVSGLGAIWSSCSPDFGAESVIERFAQIEPKVLLTVDGYQYGGKSFDRMERIAHLQQNLTSVEITVVLPYLSDSPDMNRLSGTSQAQLWQDFSGVQAEPVFEPVPFDHPLWVLYSSGTTGLPKPITHGHGGMTLEHLKYLDLHCNITPGDRFFWYTTTGWMMWNVVVASMLRGATAVLYDGSPGYPELNVLWKFAERSRMSCFGTSAAYLMNCYKSGLTPKNEFSLNSLEMVGSTGSPLPPEGYKWVYDYVGDDVIVNSTSGGTDICSSFVGGNPILPVYAGEIQCRTLGTKVEAYNEQGEPVIEEVGEMVITQPLPCMPIYFWGDEDGSRYRDSYFSMYPGVWRHGDWIKIKKRGTCVIYGRSDATLNRMGIRIGTSEIYRAVELDDAIADSLVVSLEKSNGDWYMPLFVMPKQGYSLTDEVKSGIAKRIRERISPKFIPDDIIEVSAIPYTLSGKKMEKPVKRILEGEPVKNVASPDAMKNPEALEQFKKES